MDFWGFSFSPCRKVCHAFAICLQNVSYTPENPCNHGVFGLNTYKNVLLISASVPVILCLPEEVSRWPLPFPTKRFTRS